MGLTVLQAVCKRLLFLLQKPLFIKSYCLKAGNRLLNKLFFKKSFLNLPVWQEYR